MEHTENFRINLNENLKPKNFDSVRQMLKFDSFTVN